MIGSAARAVGAGAYASLFFHISRGKHTFTDSAGVELVGIAAARTHTTTKIRDMRASVPAGRLQDWSGWTMTVVDAKGKIVFEVGFDFTPSSR